MVGSGEGTGEPSRIRAGTAKSSTTAVLLAGGCSSAVQSLQFAGSWAPGPGSASAQDAAATDVASGARWLDAEGGTETGAATAAASADCVLGGGGGQSPLSLSGTSSSGKPGVQRRTWSAELMKQVLPAGSKEHMSALCRYTYAGQTSTGMI